MPNDKRKLVKTKRTEKLKHTIDRYTEVFEAAGVETKKWSVPSFIFSEDELNFANSYLAQTSGSESSLRIGIAPFARHATKQWQTEKVSDLIELIASNNKVQFLLFGAPDEKAALLRIAGNDQNVRVISDLPGFREELAVISCLSYMISMDSSNMHLAALAGIRTISIWGGTHSSVGFSAVGGQSHMEIGLSSDEIDCRPCTVYGKGECRRDDQKFKCLEDISALMVYNKMKSAGMVS